ncbi:bifunctional DNA primase/polymerase [Streptomyces sp. NBC_00233]|uniref:bifunctional DNA primase/polymerase n=1 Tax=Streptomyces sp. NBC_00233 TaxID=2975686 RepID=UPI002253C9A8|nr:bifunctional DNA primase/polymerase [Streptomyces sp. NBC_00233]MCX5227542.1 bifunctional DNA primase/polymerase [Streptomyces sp. NBC_00233]
MNSIPTTALGLAEHGLPVLPLLADKRPFSLCRACEGLACGGRPNMATPGPCACPRPCHGWAAATTDPTVVASPQWTAAWRRARTIGYHPGGAGVTIVDLDNPAAVDWARTTLPPTATVTTTRGQHWIYRGTMRSVNAVRAGVDIKSAMSYARWLGPGTGTLAELPDVVRALAEKKSAPVRLAPRAVTVPAPTGSGQCPHRSPTYLERGIAMAEQRITNAPSAVHTTVYRTFLAVLSAHGRCGCLTEAHIGRLFTAAQSKGESPRHCTTAWSNATTALGM